MSLPEFYTRYYKRYFSDLAWTGNLTLEERGLYYMLVDRIFFDGSPLVIEPPNQAAHMCGCSVRKFRSLLSNLFRKGFFSRTPDGRLTSPVTERRLIEAHVERMRVGMTEALRQKVFLRDRFLCVYCDADVFLDAYCDHRIPVSQWGTNDFDNLATSCLRCNTRNGARTVEQWRQIP